MTQHIRLAIGAIAGCIAMVQVHAADLLFDNTGKLAGAKSISVDGQQFDVAFIDGSCQSVFFGCDPSNFTFHTMPAAIIASAALRDQVFLGVLSDDPTMTSGCAFVNFCDVMTPYNFQPLSNLAYFSNFHNESNLHGPSWGNDYVSEGITFSQTNIDTMVWAKWAASPVPEPATSTLLLVGFATIALRLIKK